MEMVVEVYEAGPPLEGKWVVMWRTPVMAAPAFRYFDTREDAEAEAKRLRDAAAPACGTVPEGRDGAGR